MTVIQSDLCLSKLTVISQILSNGHFGHSKATVMWIKMTVINELAVILATFILVENITQIKKIKMNEIIFKNEGRSNNVKNDEIENCSRKCNFAKCAPGNGYPFCVGCDF